MITIDVTQEDIDAGQKCDGRACPVYFAICRAGLDVGYVDGIQCGYYRERATGLVTTWLPSVAKEFVIDFDCGGQVRPFSFELDVTATDLRRLAPDKPGV